MQTNLETLKGKRVLLMCAAFFYEGRVVAVSDSEVTLESPAIIYDTGEWKNNGYESAEQMGEPLLYVQRQAIEAYRIAK